MAKTNHGHWEMAEICREGVSARTKRCPHRSSSFIGKLESPILGKVRLSTEIIRSLATSMSGREPIVYTTAISFPIAAHEQVIPLPKLTRSARRARMLDGQHKVGRVLLDHFLVNPVVSIVRKIATIMQCLRPEKIFWWLWKTKDWT